MFRKMSTLGFAGLLGACSVVGPDFHRPNIDLPQSFAFASGSGGLEVAARHSWWSGFEDPLLEGIVARAMAQNINLEIARLRIEESRALLGTAGRNAQLSGSVSARVTARQTGRTDWAYDKSVTFQPSFLVDLFGGERRTNEALIADVDAAAFEAAAARIALQMEVVSVYIELRYNEAAIRERRRSIDIKLRTADAVKARVDLGEATRVDLRRSQAEIATLRAQIPNLEIGRELAVLRLATLLAEPAAKIARELAGTGQGQPKPPGQTDPGVPVDLVRIRPDVRAAEAAFARAVAEIGIRKAQLYPSLQLTGTLTASTTNAFQVGPVLSFPLLDRGLRKARLEAAQIAAKRTESAWRQSVIEAVEDVQIALVRYQKSTRREQELGRAVALYRDTFALTEEAFKLGTLTVDDVLSTEDSASSVRLQRVDARLERALAWAQLNAALGLGWMPAPAHEPELASGE